MLESEGSTELSPREAEIVRDINRRVGATNSIVELIDFVFSRIRTVLPCDRIGVAFVEEQGARLVSHYGVANFAPLWLKKGFAQDLRGSSLQAVIEQGQPRILNDLVAYHGEHPHSASTALIVREGIQSSLTCPLVVDGRAIGVLFFSSCQPKAYDQKHVHLHLAIAEQLAQTAEKAYRIEQLENANRAYMEMLSFVAHELKNPVASMVTSARLITDGYLGEVVPAQREKIERIIGKGEYLIALVGDYLDLAQVENAETATSMSEVADLVAAVIDPAIDLLQDQIDASGMRLERDLPLVPESCCGDPALLRIVVSNLLSNAIKYGQPGGRVSLRLRVDGENLEFSLRNEGPGFPPEKRGELFRRFSRLNTPELLRQKGSGIGLYTCWKIIQRHAGRIWAESEPGRWARFSFSVPRRCAV